MREVIHLHHPFHPHIPTTTSTMLLLFLLELCAQSGNLGRVTRSVRGRVFGPEVLLPRRRGRDLRGRGGIVLVVAVGDLDHGLDLALGRGLLDVHAVLTVELCVFLVDDDGNHSARA